MKVPVSIVLVACSLIGCGQAGSANDIGFLEPLDKHVTLSPLSANRFCCDPDQPFPQDIGTLTLSNNYPAVTITVKIGPFTNGVIADVGPEFQLAPGPGVVTVTLQATHCGWTTSEGTIQIDGDQLLGGGSRITRQYTLTNDCPRDQLRTGLEISGLARAHFDTVNDPSPYGPDPVLYVIGASNNSGVEAYAFRTNANGKILNMPKVHTVNLFVADDDIVPVAWAMGGTRAFYAFASASYARTHWQGSNWGGFAIGGSTKDLVTYGGNSYARGICYTTSDVVRFEEYDAALMFFNGIGVLQQLGGEMNFPGETGAPATAFVDNTSGAAIIVMSGSPGQIWFHDRQDASKEATKVGADGNDPRQVRARNGIAVVSNYGSDTISVLRWDGATRPTITGSILGLGNTMLVDPLKLDLITLKNGNTALAVASDTTDRWWMGEIDSSGIVVNSWTGTFGVTGGLADVVFLPGKTTYLAVAAKGIVDVKLIDTGLEADPQ